MTRILISTRDQMKIIQRGLLDESMNLLYAITLHLKLSI